MKTQTLTLIFAIYYSLALGGSSAAQDHAAEQEDLAKTVQNPLASLVSLPFQANYNNGVGEHDRLFFNLNIQPVVPFPGEKWNVITRTIIPVNSVPVGETDSVFGIGDTSFSVFLSPAKASSLTWGVGPAITIPSASNPEVLGSDKLSLGPTGVVFYGVGKWTLGAVASQVWSVAGNSNRQDVSFFFAQWFLNFNFGGGLGVRHRADHHWELGSRLRQPMGDSVGPADLQGVACWLAADQRPDRLLQKLRAPGGRRRQPGPVPDQLPVPSGQSMIERG